MPERQERVARADRDHSEAGRPLRIENDAYRFVGEVEDFWAMLSLGNHVEMLLPTDTAVQLSILAGASTELDGFLVGISYLVHPEYHAMRKRERIPYDSFLKGVQNARRLSLALDRQLVALEKEEPLFLRSLFKVGAERVKGLDPRCGASPAAVGEVLSQLRFWDKLAGVTFRIMRPGRRGRNLTVLVQFVEHLEFVARGSDGHWTLDKTSGRGTLVDALEILRPLLPDRFLPRMHPFSSYRRALTRAGMEWERFWTDRRA